MRGLPYSLVKINVNMTVMPKAVAYPTDKQISCGDVLSWLQCKYELFSKKLRVHLRFTCLRF